MKSDFILFYSESRKPQYRGPDDKEAIRKAETHPFRIVIVSQKGNLTMQNVFVYELWNSY